MTHESEGVQNLQQWEEFLVTVSPDLRRRVAKVVDDIAVEIADTFYSRMQADPQAGKLLNHTIVDERLHASMVRWLQSLFTPTTPLREVLAMQLRAGEMHARVGVSVDLVAQGARILKREITARLAKEDFARHELPEAFEYVYELFDLAIGTLTSAYNGNVNRLTRADEAYRLFFLGQDMKAERERQKLQLLEWAHNILVTHYWDPGDGDESGQRWSGGSQFELWLQHKASLLFEGAAEVGRIQALIAHIEREMLPALGRVRASRDESRTIVSEIDAQIDEIKSLLASMFDRFIEVEDGRDGVTRLLNRRFFPSVARREIAFAQAHTSRFAVLLVEIDAFDELRETLGVEGADSLLVQVADLLNDSVRAGDFVFRFGDGQFLVLLVEVTESTVLPVAEGLRKRVEETSLRTPHRASMLASVSVGVALFDGHPDYQHLFDRAGLALAKARAMGPNHCAMADEPAATGG